MRAAVMQPYLFPYIGYFQLINVVDSFVLFDDVRYINRGWINRNRILAGSDARLFTLSLNKASQNKLISEITITADDSNRRKIIDTLVYYYKKAPQFRETIDFAEKIILNKEENLANYLCRSIEETAGFLGLVPRFFVSSRLEKFSDLKGQSRIIDIVSRLGADEYVNLPGGKELYDFAEFRNKNIRLMFLQPRDIVYRQFSGDFVPGLSILDVLMFNPRERVKEFLAMCDLEGEGDFDGR